MPRDLRGLPKNRQCAVFPWLRCATWHHTHSAAYEPTVPARMGWNCVPVSRTGHWLIHVVLGGSGRMVIEKGQRYWSGRAGRDIGAIEIQKHYAYHAQPWASNPALWLFPNPFQRIIHVWCRLTFFVLWLLWYGRNFQSWLVRALAGVLAFQVPGFLAQVQEVWLWAKIFG